MLQHIRSVLMSAALMAGLSAGSAGAQILGGYVHRASGSGQPVIVFMHGLSGNARVTWTNSQSGAYWPKQVALDVPQADVFVVDYVSALGDETTFAKLVDDMDVFWKDHGLWQYDNITIVAHSLGGIVARQLVLRNAGFAAKIKLMYLLATPSGGSRLANYAVSIGFAGAIVKDLRSIDSGSPLAVLVNAWNQSESRGIPTYCGVEGRPTAVSVATGSAASPGASRSLTPASMVVSFESGGLLCNRKITQHQQHDHASIAKPNGGADSVHTEFLQAFARR